jgi:ubiquitin-protein ligase
MTTTVLVTSKWHNQQIKKKFKNRSYRSRAKRATNGLSKQIPSSMLRGWIRGKAPTYGKLTKDTNRSSYYLRTLQYRSVHDFEYITYGDGHDDYNEYWLDNINDSWLRQQRQQQPELTSSSCSKSLNDPIKIKRKSVWPKRPKNTKQFAMPIPPVLPLPFQYSAVPQMASFESMQMPPPPFASQPFPRRENPPKTTVTDKEYQKTEQEEKAYEALGEEYVSMMKDLESPHGVYAAVEGLAKRSSFSSHCTDQASNAQAASMKKILMEIRKELPQNIHTSINGAMFVRFDAGNPRFLQALLTGLDDTPYENGLFLFDVYLNDNYPTNPLDIKHVSYGATKCHANNGPGGFSPNLHQSTGKVCLSLLGTWSGPGWENGKSNVYQVLSSILFMIFGATHPYYMEPSYGGWEGTVAGKKEHERRVIEYDEEVMYHNLKYTLLEALKTPYAGFESVIKLHFKLKAECMMKTVERWLENENYSDAFKAKMKPVYDEFKVELEKVCNLDVESNSDA